MMFVIVRATGSLGPQVVCSGLSDWATHLHALGFRHNHAASVLETR